MTGPKGNSDFCFPENLNVPKDELKENIEGKQNSLFPVGPVEKCFLRPPNSKLNNTRMSNTDKYKFAAVSKVHDLITCE